MKYNIQRWDAVLYEGNVNPFPMIYIKPDEQFKKLAELNNYNIFVRIEGTNSIYDGKAMVGIVDTSATTPNNRLNFYNDTGLWIISLYSMWYGYPPDLGQAVLYGLKGPDSLLPVKVPPFQAPKPIEEAYTNRKCGCSGLNNNQLILTMVAIMVIFMVLVIFLS